MIQASTAHPEAAEHDPLDLHMQRLGASAGSGWSIVSSQTSLLLLAGMLLGPQGLAVLGADAIALLQPAVPVALALVGAHLAFALGDGARRRLHTTIWALALLACGVLISLAGGGPARTAPLLAQASAIVILLAGAGWFLASRGGSDDERRVFWIATLLLIGGVADYLSVSGLLLGLVAVGAWQLLRPRALKDVRIDAEHFQHPLLALLLVLAGARAILSWRIVIAAVAAAIGASVLAAMLGRRGRSSLVPAGLPLTWMGVAVAVASDAALGGSQLAVTVLSVVALAAAAVDGLYPPDRWRS